ncbi:hypothetical protein DTW90_20135 [Neorhizobium sp. P12A]|uniref:RNA-binding domain-containing protein n=1 Tax=Neorhizobium sp. P12A TaxID=2268027 RepID=UPI0011ECD35C|nr:RNA-binding domain-containing protein [Neorhizobium sp. P12A]KAA0697687.1 hypothetical protein DTW90_20135 [Neorhizobium sp. P12A]
MMWQINNISENSVEALLKKEEDQFCDFKDKSNVAKCTKTISAFANADGGDLYIGIRDRAEDDRLGYLFVNPEEANGCISAIYEQFAEGVEYLYVEYLQFPAGGLCLHVIVQKTPFVVYSSDKRVFKRQNASDRELKTAADQQALFLEKGIRSFEDAAVEATSGEISKAPLMKIFLENVVPHSTVEDLLRKERLSTDDRLRACALLLFDENPQSLLPQAAVKLYRYRTLASEGDREDLEGQPLTIEGPIYDLIYKAVSKTKEKVEEIPLMSQGGLASIKYPEEAIHEVICNALLHRDYSINDYVHIRVFDNRIEVESPGRLAGPITVKNILKQRFVVTKKLFVLLQNSHHRRIKMLARDSTPHSEQCSF